MSQRKRKQIIKTNDDAKDHTKKLQRTFSMASFTNTNRCSITLFEDLSNESIYEILEYLDGYDIYRSFFNVNTRFRNSTIHVNLSMKISYETMSKSTFVNDYMTFIRLMKDQIKSLDISEPFTIEYLFPITDNFSTYSQLQTLSIHNTGSEYLLKHLAVLPNLRSLTIDIGFLSNPINIYGLIFQLPVLQYCQLSFEKYHSLSITLPVMVNRSSPIKYLIIDDQNSINNVDLLLPYLPQLRRLSITTRLSLILILILLKNSTQLIFMPSDKDYNSIVQCIQKHNEQIKFLYISTTDGNILKLEELKNTILSYLPYLKKFHFRNPSEISCEYTFDIYNSAFNQFSLPTTDIHQWFFTSESMSDEDLHRIFCSFKLSRTQIYNIRHVLPDNKPICHREKNISTVHNVIIYDPSVMKACSKSFSYVTELTLATGLNTPDIQSSMDHFNRVISLTQLTKLTLCGSLRLSGIVNILLYIRNIRTLSVTPSRSSAKQNLELQESETFKLVSKQNKIQNIITYPYTLEMIQMIIKLCPRLQHLTLTHSGQNIERIIRFLLMKHDPTVWHLSSLRILYVDATCAKKIKTLVKSKKHLGDYSLKIIVNTLYLWW